MPRSRDLPNADPVLDIVIDELMYHPVDSVDANEYVELYNPTSSRIYLSNGVGSWRLDDSGDGDLALYYFDSGASIAGHQRLLVVSFDPTDSVLRAEFESRHGVGPLTPGVDIVGPMLTGLSNDGERVTLERPQAPDDIADDISWVVVDQVRYSDVPPWPASADGDGDVLQRVHADQYHHGSDPTNWQPAEPSPGG